MKNNFYTTILILLCTSLIILTNYISSKNSVEKIYNKIMQTEYSKIWWQENYDLLRELQKKEILTYLETIKKEKPELIQEIKNQIKASASNWNYNFLSKEDIKLIKDETYIKWYTWTIISIIEFSDLECEHCIDFHNWKIIDELISIYPENINYIFKNFPLPSYTNSRLEAISAICVKDLTDWNSYLKYIDKIFSSTKGWWEWIELSKLNEFASELNIKQEDFETGIEQEERDENLWKDIIFVNNRLKFKD
jgi:hypothetical protein